MELNIYSGVIEPSVHLLYIAPTFYVHNFGPGASMKMHSSKFKDPMIAQAQPVTLITPVVEEALPPVLVGSLLQHLDVVRQRGLEAPARGLIATRFFWHSFPKFRQENSTGPMNPHTRPPEQAIEP